MIVAAEAMLGPYVWGVYDLLVLPPSFPYGGMENPCLTFVTPTLLVGNPLLDCISSRLVFSIDVMTKHMEIEIMRFSVVGW